MDGQNVASRLTEIVHIADGTVDHQVNVQRKLGDLADGGNHRDTDGDIGNKKPIHHVYMDVIRTGGGQSADITLQIHKIRG